jgi:hypothetical protein
MFFCRCRYSDKVVVANNKYYASEQCKEARQALQRMVEDGLYNTELSRSTDKSINFVDHHLEYLSTHKVANLAGYISNLKLMTSLKRSGRS